MHVYPFFITPGPRRAQRLLLRFHLFEKTRWKMHFLKELDRANSGKYDESNSLSWSLKGNRGGSASDIATLNNAHAGEGVKYRTAGS